MVQCLIGTIQFVACVSVSGPELFMLYRLHSHVAEIHHHFFMDRLPVEWCLGLDELHNLCNPSQYLTLGVQNLLKQNTSKEEYLLSGGVHALQS